MQYHFSHSSFLKPVAAALLAAAVFSSAASAAACPLYAVSGSIAAVDIDPLTPPQPQELGAIAPTLEELTAKQQELAEEELTYIPHVWPVHFSEIGIISSYFGYRINPTEGVGTEFHGGVDLADKLNSKIYAAGSGTVVEAGKNGGYGLTILIDHGNGYQSRYCHCSSLLVSEGDTVQQGEIIATMGRTGRATGVHLDFRVYIDGSLVDPLEILDPLSD